MKIGEHDTLAITHIRLDGGTQSRAETNAQTVAEYTEALASLPPVVVFFDGAEHWLADGFHRVRAHESAGCADIACIVKQGTRRDAILYSVGANQAHGLRRTNADKRRAVETLLRDEEWGAKSDRWIAEACGVHHVFVGKVRSELVTVTSSTSAPRTGRDGKTRALPKREPMPDTTTAVEAQRTPAAPAPTDRDAFLAAARAARAAHLAEHGPVREVSHEDRIARALLESPIDDEDENAGLDDEDHYVEFVPQSAAASVSDFIEKCVASWPPGESTFPLRIVLGTWIQRLEKREKGSLS